MSSLRKPWQNLQASQLSKDKNKETEKTKLKTKNLSYTGADAINPTDMET